MHKGSSYILKRLPFFVSCFASSGFENWNLNLEVTENSHIRLNCSSKLVHVASVDQIS